MQGTPTRIGKCRRGWRSDHNKFGQLGGHFSHHIARAAAPESISLRADRACERSSASHRRISWGTGDLPAPGARRAFYGHWQDVHICRDRPQRGVVTFAIHGRLCRRAGNFFHVLTYARPRRHVMSGRHALGHPHGSGNTYCTENNTLLARTHDPASPRYTLSSPAVRLPVARTLLKSDSTLTSILGGPGNLR